MVKSSRFDNNDKMNEDMNLCKTGRKIDNMRYDEAPLKAELLRAVKELGYERKGRGYRFI